MLTGKGKACERLDVLRVGRERGEEPPLRLGRILGFVLPGKRSRGAREALTHLEPSKPQA